MMSRWIDGYQVCAKCLKDRKVRILSLAPKNPSSPRPISAFLFVVCNS